jgi:AcrR family transcriptional regulator
MPPLRRPRTAPTSKRAMATSSSGEARGSRRKRDTRARLLAAALSLMAEKGGGVAISEITEAADVGFGSFYNHFTSKKAIRDALTDCVLEDFADMIDKITRHLSDPAQIISVSVRHTMLRAKSDPRWGQFLMREGFSSQGVSRGLGLRLTRDIAKGIAAGRFAAADILLCAISVGGTVLSAIAMQLQLDSTTELDPEILLWSEFSRDHLAERTAATSLRTLGLTASEAVEIAYQALPVVAHRTELE